MKVIIESYREGSRWFIDDDNGFTKEENELVSGAPSLISSLIGEADRAKVTASDKPLPDSIKLNLLLDELPQGVTYFLDTDRNKEIWLCQVFFHYFIPAPKELYIRIKKSE